MRVQIAYTSDGEFVAGKVIGGRASLAPGPHYQVGEFEVEDDHEGSMHELWDRIRVDVSNGSPTLILAD
jgi:hypothetical protein